MTFRVEGFPVPAGVIAFLDEWFGDGESVPACTSGSTGAPRRVDLLKDDMLASAALSNAYFGVTSRSTLLLCLSPGYIAGKMMIVRAILAGARLLAVEPSRDPLAVLPGEERVDLAAMVPLQVEATLAREDGTGRLARVRQLLVGGAALSPSLEGRLGGLPVECHASYGMTETASHVALRRVNGPRASRLYATLGNTRLALDDRGCLVIRAPHLRQGIFITNDLARLDGSTRFEWLGRLDNVINSGGVKLFPEAIEARAASCLSRRFFITAMPDALLGERVTLVVEGDPWSEEERAAVSSRLARVLAPFERPRGMIFLPSFRETSSGKIIRSIPPDREGRDG